MDCKSCGDHGEVQKIPYIAYEAECARHDRAQKRAYAVIALLVAVVCFMAVLLYRNNQKWLEMMGEYDFEEIDYSQDGRGINIIGDENETRQFNGAEIENSTENP